MLLREASTLLGKRSDEENEDEEKDHEPKIVSVPAFSSQYCIAKDVDRVLRGKGTKKCVLLMYEKTYEYLNSVKSRLFVRYFSKMMHKDWEMTMSAPAHVSKTRKQSVMERSARSLLRKVSIK
ncbi:hypothetical protein QR680_010888 [Steinernema hermaphroditum]|uniref:Uncharacterized protein n=1 Tax=Steinernema hermaphroditum TaxID=289476 RepID=A0AA39IQF3_9BILA|nr:hypothetical protein QR680_010888 [Steinernema hermaphroditum]